MAVPFCDLRGFGIKKNLTEINHKVSLIAKWDFGQFGRVNGDGSHTTTVRGGRGARANQRCYSVELYD
jgi:hypothetical protein